MKKTTLALGFTLGAACALTTTESLSQDDVPMEMPPIVKEFTEAAGMPMQPSSFHRKLDPFVGEWEIVMKIFFEGPEGPSMESSGTGETTWILDGRFMQASSSYMMSYPDGAGGMLEFPHNTLMVTGYNNYRNQYQTMSVGNMDTQMLVATGSCDPEGKVFTHYGTMDEPALRITGRTVKYVATWISDDQYTVEVFDLHVGPDYKVIEMVYHRK